MAKKKNLNDISKKNFQNVKDKHETKIVVDTEEDK